LAAVTVVVTVTRVTTGRPPCPLGDLRAPVGAYEWRESAWRTRGARDDLVEAARRLCLDQVRVDLTGAATAGGEDRRALLADVRSLAAAAAERDLLIGAVAGDRWWPSPDGHREAAAVLDFVAEANRNGTAVSSIHIDAEPWGLDEWRTQRDGLTVAYLDLVASLERHRTDLRLDVPVAYLVPYWFDGSNGEAVSVEYGGRSAVPFDHLTEMLGRDASLIVMAYRNRAAGAGGIVEISDRETRNGRVDVGLAVETAPIEPPTATFAGQGSGRLAEQLGIAIAAAQPAEIAINDLEHLRLLAATDDGRPR
jgi:hypothetical protein